MKDEAWEIFEARTKLEESVNTLRELEGKKPRYRFTDRLHLEPEPPLCSLCSKGKNQVGTMLTIKLDNLCEECIILLYEGLEP